jgi:sugar phosphate isomerase/epimerase
MTSNQWPATADLVASSWMVEGQRPAMDAGPCPIPIERRATAAVAAGFAGIGLNRADYEALVQQHGLQGLARILSDAGIRHAELETVTGWWSEDPDGAQWRGAFDRMLEFCAYFLVRQIKLNGDFAEPGPSIETMRAGFATLARDAQSAGTVAALEPVAFSNVRDPGTARAITGDTVGHGGGVMLDCWHFARCGRAPRDLGGIERQAISGVEISNISPAIVGSLFEDTVDHRHLPDMGPYDVAAFLGAVAETGYDGPIGCEVLSIELRAMPIELALQAAAASTRRIVAMAVPAAS